MLFVTVSVIYRPIEQLLSRTIADRRARGFEHDHPLRTPLLIQAGFALGFLVVALALRGPIEDDLFDGSATLYWILVVAVLAYAASYFARGWLAGHQWFGLYGGLVFLEACSRLAFAVAVAVGIAAGPVGGRARHGGGAVRLAGRGAVGVLAPAAGVGGEARADDEALGLARGGRFALAVLAVMVAEQTLLNAGVLLVDWTSEDAAVAGFVFNVLLIARAPLQLFQAIQGSLLPHLAGLEAREGRAEFARAIRVTVLAIAGFAGAVALGLRARRPVRDGHPVRRRVHLRPLGPRARRDRDGLPPHRRHAQPGRAGARPRGHRGGVLAAHAPPRSWPSWSARSSTTSCCARRSATAGRRRCCARCSPWSTALLLRFFRAT